MEAAQPDIEMLISKHPALLLYLFSDNCQPCIQFRPMVEALIKEEFQEMELVFINADKYPAIAASKGVFSSPTIIAYFDGREYTRWGKFLSISQLRESLYRPYHLLIG